MNTILTNEIVNTDVILSVKLLYAGTIPLTAIILWIVITLYKATVNLGNLQEAHKELRIEVKEIREKVQMSGENQLLEIKAISEMLKGFFRKSEQ